MTTKYSRCKDNDLAEMPLWQWLLECLLGMFLFMILYGIFSMAEWMNAPDTVKTSVAIAGGIAMVVLMVLWSKIFEKKWAWDQIGRKVPQNLLGGMGIGLIYFSVLTGIIALSGCYHIESVSWQNDIITSFFLYFIVACGEEVLFRGILFRMIDGRFGTWVALIVSGLLFGLMHIPNDNGTLWGAIAIAIEAGLLLGAAYKLSGSLWFPIGIHWTWNFTQGSVFGFAVSGNEIGDSIIIPSVSGPDIITGGAFGPEASIFCVILGTLLTALFIYLDLRKPAQA